MKTAAPISAAGTETDFRAVVETHGPRVWATVSRLLTDRQDALDCYQDTLLDAWRFSGRETVQHWPALLVRIATTRALDQLRRRYRRLPEANGASGVSRVSHEPEPAQQIEARELAGRLRLALATLPDTQAAAFTLHCIEQMSYHDVASHLETTPQNARVLVHRARQKLRDQLETQSVHTNTGEQA